MRRSRFLMLISGIGIFIAGYYADKLEQFFVSTHTVNGLITVAVAVGVYTIFHLKCEVIKYQERCHSNDRTLELYHRIGEIKAEINNAENNIKDKIDEKL